MKKTTRNMALLAMFATIAVAGFATKHLLSRTTAPGVEKRSDDVARSREKAGAKAASHGATMWRQGFAYHYDVSLASSLFMEQGDAPSLSTELLSEAVFTVVERDAAHTLLKAVLMKPTFSVGTGEDDKRRVQTDETAKLEADFEDDFFILLESSGALDKVLFRKSLSGTAQSTIKTLASLMQFVSSDAHQSSWRTEETDTMGRYAAEYRSQPDTVATEKSKTRYLLPNDGTETTGRAEVVFATATYDWRRDGAMQHLEAQERVKRSGVSSMPSGEAETKLSMGLKKVSTALNLNEMRNAAAALFAATPDSPSTAEAMQKILDLAKIEGLDFNRALQLLHRHSSESSEDRHKRNKAFLSIEAQMRQYPETIDTAVSEINKHGEHTKVLTAALGYAGTPKAQTALLDLVQNPPEKSSPLPALRALSLGENPTEENIEAQASLIDDPVLGKQTRYGLGALAAALQRGNRTERAGDLVDLLAEKLADATDEGEIQTLLKALGNSGHPRVAEIVLPYLAHTQPEIRVTAVGALKNLPAGPADELIVLQLKTDPADSVRNAALRVLSARPMTAEGLTTIAYLAKTETNETVRHRAVLVLGGMKSAGQPVVNVLKWVSEHDKSKEIRSAAANALAA